MNNENAKQRKDKEYEDRKEITVSASKNSTRNNEDTYHQAFHDSNIDSLDSIEELIKQKILKKDVEDVMRQESINTKASLPRKITGIACSHLPSAMSPNKNGTRNIQDPCQKCTQTLIRQTTGKTQ